VQLPLPRVSPRARATTTPQPLPLPHDSSPNPAFAATIQQRYHHHAPPANPPATPRSHCLTTDPTPAPPPLTRYYPYDTPRIVAQRPTAVPVRMPPVETALAHVPAPTPAAAPAENPARSKTTSTAPEARYVDTSPQSGDDRNLVAAAATPTNPAA